MKCHGVSDDAFASDIDLLNTQIAKLQTAAFPVINENAQREMTAEIERAAADGDSVGGIIESAVINLPAGIGEPFFDSLESIIAHYLYSIPAVKGVAFGLGFRFSDYTGSEVNDALAYKDGVVITETNNNGGINGGIYSVDYEGIEICLENDLQFGISEAQSIVRRAVQSVHPFADVKSYNFDGTFIILMKK